MELQQHRLNLFNNGYTIVNEVFSDAEINAIICLVNSADTVNPLFRKTDDLFAIRQFVKELPDVKNLLFTTALQLLIDNLLGKNYFIVKSIYFDKPEKSNWFVAYHQDLTISVKTKTQLKGYGPWTVKHNQFAVQPPLGVLEQNFTIRIHLDDTDQSNGALKVIPGSHGKGIYRAETIDWNNETEVVCPVKRGGIMVMSPLLLHSSGRNTAKKRRRVVHIEFSSVNLPEPLQWAELG